MKAAQLERELGQGQIRHWRQELVWHGAEAFPGQVWLLEIEERPQQAERENA